MPVVDLLALVLARCVLDAGLYVVRTRDVRHRTGEHLLPCAVNRRDGLGGIPEGAEIGVVFRGVGEPLRGADRRRHARHVQERGIGKVPAAADFEEQTVRHGRGPFPQDQIIGQRRIPPSAGRFRIRAESVDDRWVRRLVPRSAKLGDALDVQRELVAGRRLKSEPGNDPPSVTVPARGAAVVQETIGRQIIRAPIPHRDVVPEPILDDRPARRPTVVEDPLDLVNGSHAGVFQPLREVVGLPAARGPAEKHRPAAPVAAIPRDHVDAQTAGGHVCASPRRVEHDLLVPQILKIQRRPAIRPRRVHIHPVDRHDGMGTAQTVRRQLAVAAVARPGDVGAVHRHARSELREGPHVVRRRDRVHQLPVEDRGALSLRHVDDR